MLDQDMIMKSLSEVEDPELKISIVDLGLVYGVRIIDKMTKCMLSITLTSPGCPSALK